MVVFFSVTIFSGAALLFLVQPMIVRMLLPYFGGAPAVWNASLVFFQATLLAGYSYAHLSSRWLGVRKQIVLHFALLIAALALLPVAIPRGWLPSTDHNPVPSLLLALTIAVGLPFFVVSATSPLLQRWFSVTRHRLAGDPYFLYAASNMGSLLALVAYPAIIEPHLGLAEQSRWWKTGCVGLVTLLVLCGWIIWQFGNVGQTANLIADHDTTPVRLARRVRWLALAFVPSSLMLSVTTYMTNEIAPVPLLWVIPLGIYLLTFVLVFARRRLVPHKWMVWLLPFSVIAVLWSVMGIMLGETMEPIDDLIGLHLVNLFIVAMMCHGELANDRPPKERLTEFYLWISVGGVLGGIFNALIAPVLFPTVLEYPVTLILACALLPRRAPSRAKGSELAGDLAWAIGIGLSTAALLFGLNRLRDNAPWLSSALA